jgi:multiple sugar transport system substrate-binding protein
VGLTTGMTAQDHHWFREVLIRQFGGEPYLNGYRTVNYATDAGVKAVNYYAGLERQHGVTKSGFMDEPQAAFRAGRAGMHIDGSFRIGALQGTRGLKWGVAELPAGPTGVKSNYASYWVNAITSKAQGEKLEAAKKFMAFITTDAAMQTWLEVTGELPAKPSAALTAKNLADPVYGPFIKGLDYAHATVFADESAQRQLMIDMMLRVELQGATPEASLREAAAAEQKLLDGYFKK